MTAIILYINLSYYANIFILYRPMCYIKTRKNENIDRILTLSEVLTMTNNIIMNKI
ncbi:hypothetical protein HgNV_038 [Homarus gammarus nudivirus]|uniref:Uncharacterized protein n=1 Tax=Homarus gammarus nudivirus TaxID=2509616 RepID=A0A411HB99_9VIRU|nr:hypothetical protein KM727_gp38 [Homarus gammarus nudivirus]QBB28643.1 hypothetical protein HgNV_038 [Homarus gammarus nudivirus]